jgi:hypothetical protein
MHQIESHRQATRSRIELCIELFVAETGYVPDEARPVIDPAELSTQLERLAATILAPSAWRAWAVGPRSWFLEGRLADPPEAPADQPTLMLTFRDNDARTAAAGVWRRTAPGHWEPQHVLACTSMSGEWH